MKIAVVGATGLVGRTAVKILLDKKLFKPDQIELFASKKSDGKVIEILEEKFDNKLTYSSVYVVFEKNNSSAISFDNFFTFIV